MAKITIMGFEIDMNEVPRADIQDKCNLFSKKHRTFLKNKYGSEYDFLVLLYHLLFVKHLQKEEIAGILGWRIPNIHHQLYELGWDHSANYNENRIQDQKALTQLEHDVKTAKNDSWLLDPNQDIRLKDVLERTKDIRDDSLVGLGFKSKEEYARTLYYMKYRMGYDRPRKFIHLFHRSISSVSDRLSILGLNNSYTEGMQIKEQDYDRSLRNGRITTARHQLKNSSHGTKNQDYFRSQLSKIIYSYLPSQEYEVVVGFSDIGILGQGLEIDIPLVVYDVNEKVFYRFAIEYNGEYFHQNERDMYKKSLCEIKGWHYLAVIEATNSRYSNNPELFDPILHETCKKIRNIILESNVSVKS